MYHLIHEHSIGDTSPPIPGQLLVQIFITKEEAMSLVIQENVTTSWRKQKNIPESDSFEAYLQGPQVNKETDLTQYPKLILTSMMAKDIN